MSVSVVNNTEPKNVNIFKTAMIGGAAGLALKYAKPVTKNEVDTVLFGESDVIRANNIKQARKNVISDIVKMYSKEQKNDALNLFLERTNASIRYSNALDAGNSTAKKEAVELAKAAKEKIKAAPQAVQNEIKEMTKKVINKVRAARLLSENAIKNAVKQSRPFPAYILPGVALGALCGYIYNVIGTISED